jgi:small subunit ribosomal protein S24e
MVVDFVVRTKKFMNNPLLARKQFTVEVLHPATVCASKKEICDKLCAMYKVKNTQCAFVYGLKAQFGGGRTTGFGVIYDSVDKAKKFEPKHRLLRSGVIEKPTGIVGRRVKKDTKNKAKKLRAADKAKLLKKK